MVLDVNGNVHVERQGLAGGWCDKSLDFPKQFNFTVPVKETMTRPGRSPRPRHTSLFIFITACYILARD
jgi:hypothetical protein